MADLPKDVYTRVGYAYELKDKGDRRLYRFFEIVPGFLAWGLLILLVVGSVVLPTPVAIFVIAFDIYWLTKVIYLALHQRSAYVRMKQYLKMDWWEKLQEDYEGQWQEHWHLVVLPMYNESLDVLESTFKSLADSNYDCKKMIVVLTAEERGGEQTQETVRTIESRYKDTFHTLYTTFHPAGLPGELAGKGSNQAWGTRKVKEEVIDKMGLDYKKLIVSVLDIDTNVLPNYFARLTYAYIEHPRPWRASFQPIPFFTNNIWEAPGLARVIAFSSSFWHMMQQERPERQATFSSHSMSFHALVEIGFWQTNIVSEDSRIFWQCYLSFDGDYEVVSLFYPASMDANVGPTLWSTIVNQYKQQRRWAWGVENAAYLLFGYTKNKKIPLKKKLEDGFLKIEGYHSWATNALIIFAMGWLPVIVGGEAFNTTLLSYNLPRIVRILATAAMVGIVTSIVISINLLPPRPPQYGRRKYLWMVLQWLLLPATLIIFGSVPALDAQSRLMFGKYMGFWVTPKHRKGIQRDNRMVVESK